MSIASAVRWVTRYKTTGQISPSPSGAIAGRPIEAQRDYLLGLIGRTPDITLLEIQERLMQNCGERFSVSVLWRFFDRHGVTFKKRPRTPRSSGARTFWSIAGTGSPANSILIPQARLRRRRRFHQSRAKAWTLPARTATAGRRPAWPLQDGHDARRRSAPSRPCGAEGLRPADERRPVRGMG